MNSLMFTFSGQQISTNLLRNSNHEETSSKVYKKRPSSSKCPSTIRKRIFSSNQNQLFETFNVQSCMIETNSGNKNTIQKMKSTSIQMQQKKKLRNIIDNMLGKNFDSSHIKQKQSFSSNHKKTKNQRKNILNRTKRIQSIDFQGLNDSKQNQSNFENIDVNQMKKLNLLQNQIKNQSEIKVKRFQFANIKLHKMHNISQRYSNQQKKEDKDKITKQIDPLLRKSKQHIERQSSASVNFRGRTPKILYPQSDSKLPSVFRTKTAKSNLNRSLREKTKINSCQQINFAEDKDNQNSPNIEKSSTTRTKFRPLSLMIENNSKMLNMNAINKNEIMNNMGPKKLIFDNTEGLTERINKKLFQRSELASSAAHLNPRANTIHYPHRKLREMKGIRHSQVSNDSKDFQKKNDSHHSRETAEESGIMQTINIMQNTGGFKYINQASMACSITLHIPKE